MNYLILQVMNSEDDHQLQATLSIDEVSDLVAETGYSKPLANVNMDNREELVNSLTLYHLMIKAKSSIDQFIEGLRNVGLLRFIRDDPEIWKPLFVNSKVSLTAISCFVLVPENCRR